MLNDLFFSIVYFHVSNCYWLKLVNLKKKTSSYGNIQGIQIK